MNTPDIRTSQIKGFQRLQEQQGGLVPSKLCNGQKILIETNEYMYEFKVVSTLHGHRFILTTGAPMCRYQQIVVHIRSHFQRLKYEMADWIGYNMRLILKFQNGRSVMIGTVTGMTVEGTRDDGSDYKYNFWEKINISE